MGNLLVLVQPAELVIIGGAAVGTVLIANPLHILKKIAGGLAGVFSGSQVHQAALSGLAEDVYELLNKARRDGLLALESDIEEPDKSPIFSQVSEVSEGPSRARLRLRHLRMAVTGGIDPFDLDQMMELDMEVITTTSHAADRRAQHDGRFAARPGHRGRGAGRGDHHGRAGRAAGGDRTQGGGGAGGNVSRHSAVLRTGRAAGGQHGEDWPRTNTPTITCCGW